MVVPLTAFATLTNFWTEAPGVGSKARLSTTAEESAFRSRLPPRMSPRIGVRNLNGYDRVTLYVSPLAQSVMLVCGDAGDLVEALDRRGECRPVRVLEGLELVAHAPFDVAGIPATGGRCRRCTAAPEPRRTRLP